MIRSIVLDPAKVARRKVRQESESKMTALQRFQIILAARGIR